MTEEILKQILTIRDSGVVNMCDCFAVQKIAFDNEFFDLVNYIEENKTRYFNFIIHGKEFENK